MEEYPKIIIKKISEEIKGAVSTPATENLFKFQDGNTRNMLRGMRKIAFHHSVAQLIFAMARCRKNIQTTIAFLATRVK